MKLVRDMAEEFYKERGVILLSTRLRPVFHRIGVIFAWTIFIIGILVFLFAFLRGRG